MQQLQQKRGYGGDHVTEMILECHFKDFKVQAQYQQFENSKAVKFLFTLSIHTNQL